jgi:hypothetical protein
VTKVRYSVDEWHGISLNIMHGNRGEVITFVLRKNIVRTLIMRQRILRFALMIILALFWFAGFWALVFLWRHAR